MSRDIFSKPKNEMKFNYGGQAVIEGVLMRGQKMSAIAARDPEGRIIIHEQPLNKALYQSRVMKTPFVRGLVGLWDALGLGMRALMWSADVQGGEDEVNFNGVIGFGVVAFALAFGLFLFSFIPATVSTFIGGLLGLTGEGGVAPVGINATLVNVIEGVVQLAILVAYISIIGLEANTKRLFGYHGAEHKTINAYEAGDELTPEIVSKYPIEHPRCGTAFLLTVFFVGIFVFSLLGRPPFLLLILSRVILIPVIAGIAYELLRWTAANIEKPIVRLMVTPNLALQHLTTREPDHDMIEVAIVAFKRVLLAEGLITAEEAAVPEEVRPQDTIFAREYLKEKAEKEAKAAALAQSAEVDTGD